MALPLHNSHVIKWLSWRIWIIRNYQPWRQLAWTILVEWHNNELEKTDTAASVN